VGLLAVAPAAGAASPARLTLKTVRVGSPGNRAVSVVPFTDAIYPSCSVAPKTPAGCLRVGSVASSYRIGELEVTVAQWVAFLNTVDPRGTDPHDLYDSSESAASWPRYGQIDFASRARRGFHYRVAFRQWADKPYGFASFLRAARFVNSLTNGKVLRRRARRAGGFSFVTYRVRLSRRTERGRYNLARHKRSGATRARKRGFVVPSQNEWIKAAYYDPSGGGTLSYWKYPTNAGVFGDGTATAPASTTLDPGTGDVTNAATQPLANFKPSGSTAIAPHWCPSQVSGGMRQYWRDFDALERWVRSFPHKRWWGTFLRDSAGTGICACEAASRRSTATCRRRSDCSPSHLQNRRPGPGRAMVLRWS
jgi:Domain of unknown function (DUF4188)